MVIFRSFRVLSGILLAVIVFYLFLNKYFLDIYSFINDSLVDNPEYRLVMSRKLPCAGNLTSLTWVPEENVLVATLNQPTSVVKISTNGEVISRSGLGFIEDAESVEYIGHNKIALLDEKNAILHIINLSNIRPDRPEKSIDLQMIEPQNSHDFEDMAWDPQHNMIYIAREHQPTGLYAVRLDPANNISGVSNYEYMLDNIRLKDISGLNYNHNQLLVLSDESKMLLQMDSGGRVTARLSLTRGNFGLNSDMPQPEGVAADKDGNIYVVSKPNLFYKLAPASL
ncbi:hypothetical protein TUM12370_19550 [Salmonella enterica subsp. enterica serovar Choleraesuis]|nr:hypothetical protein TUM12370_19550 [Salmonella enterica subsp. enterica serovar Choleraesuis]